MAITFTNQATLTVGGEQILSNIATGQIEETLSVIKNAVDTEYSANEVVTYIVSLVNNAGTPASALTLTDDLGAFEFDGDTVRPLTYVEGSVQYYQNGALQADPDVDTDEGLVITGITVPANGNALIVYAARVNEFAPLASGSQIVNTVTVDGADICEVTAEETITVEEGAQLSVSKSISPVPIAANGEVTYTITIQNAGNAAVTEESGAVITDMFNPIISDIAVTFNGAALTEGEGYNYNEDTGLFSTVEGIVTVPEATFTRNPETGEVTVTPGESTLVITGVISSCPDNETTRRNKKNQK